MKHLPAHFGASLDHDPSSRQVSVARPRPIRIWVATHSMVVVVPVSAVQFLCVDPSTVKAGHSGAEWKVIGVKSRQGMYYEYEDRALCYYLIRGPGGSMAEGNFIKTLYDFT